MELFGTDIQGGDIFHNLHHRYFEVNYGMSLVPMDKWFSTWHDGSMEAHEVMKDRKRQPPRPRTPTPSSGTDGRGVPTARREHC